MPLPPSYTTRRVRLFVISTNLCYNLFQRTIVSFFVSMLCKEGGEQMQLHIAREARRQASGRSEKPLQWVRCYNCQQKFWFQLPDPYPIQEVGYFKNCFRRLLASSRCPDHRDALALDIM